MRVIVVTLNGEQIHYEHAESVRVDKLYGTDIPTLKITTSSHKRGKRIYETTVVPVANIQYIVTSREDIQ